MNKFSNSDKEWPQSIDINCWWCRHSFDTQPVSLPEKLIDSVFHLQGCFCSFNCALKHNYSLNDYKVWERVRFIKIIT